MCTEEYRTYECFCDKRLFSRMHFIVTDSVVIDKNFIPYPIRHTYAYAHAKNIYEKVLADRKCLPLGPGGIHLHLGRPPLGRHPLGRHPRQTPPNNPPRQTPPSPKTTTPPEGTHPTGMHSCLRIKSFLWTSNGLTINPIDH